MTLSAVATRYAHALADVVTSSTSPLRADEAVAQLRAFETALRSSPALRNAMSTPAVPANRKRAVIARIGYVLELGQITRNFLYVLVDHGRISSLTQIIHGFELAVEERLGFARLEVVSASELSEAQQTALRTELERLTGKSLRARYAVDGGLIGGVVARIGSTVYDGSVKRQLDLLQRRMGAES